MFCSNSQNVRYGHDRPTHQHAVGNVWLLPFVVKYQLSLTNPHDGIVGTVPQTRA